MARSADSIKPLNEPVRVQVRTDDHGYPSEVQMTETLALNSRPRRRTNAAKGSWRRVQAVEDMYKVNELWWRGESEEIDRLYFDVRLDNSRLITIFCDLIRNEWYRQAG
jgi:hypothetical protein